MQRIFEDHAQELWEMGYSIIPIKPGTKNPEIKYDLYRDQLCSQQTLNLWIKKYPHYGIGLVTGSASGLAVIDIDIKNNEELLNKALSIFPRSPLERFGSKGLGIFIKYNGQSHRKLKYKGNDIGEIITNTLIVIPPTIHPDTKRPYNWTGYYHLDSQSKDDLLSELPCPTDEDISICEAQLDSEKIDVDRNALKQQLGRNDKLKSICGSYIKKGLLPEQIAPLILAEDAILHGEKSLFRDSNDFRKLSEQPLASAYLFASSIFSTYLKNEGKAKGNPIPQFYKKDAEKAGEDSEYSQYKLFFDDKLKRAKKCKIENVLKIKNEHGLWQPVGNMVKALRSKATDIGLSRNKVDDHFSRYQLNQKSQMLWDSVTWSGKDSIAEMVSYLSCSNLTQEEMTQLFKHWLVKAVERIDSHEQNTMIILHGKQGGGKDTFLKYFLSGFKPYFQNFTETNQEKDMFMQIAKNVVINISEFDKLNRRHPGMIKDIISRETAQFRPSHMQYFEDFQMNGSFIGSSNTEDFLTDRTGNRRFWVLENVMIKSFNYKKDLGADILAQAIELMHKKYAADESTIEKIEASVSALGPQSYEEIIVEIWNEGIETLEKRYYGRNEFTFDEVNPIVLSIKNALGWRKTDNIFKILSSLNGKCRSSTKRWYQKINDNLPKK